MKLALANTIRAEYIGKIMNFLAGEGEDVALINSNTCNMPSVCEGEECVLEICVKVTKKPYDESMQEREDYIAKLQEQAAKKAEKKREAAAEKAKAEAKRKLAEETAAAVLERAAKKEKAGEKAE